MEDKERTTVATGAKKTHPKERAGLFSNLFFCWALPFFVKGYKKDLSEDDLYGPLKAHESKILGDKLEAAWNHEKNFHRNPSLWRAMVRVFGYETALFGIVVLIQELIIKMAQPFLIGKFLSYYTPHQMTVTKSEAYLYGSLIVLGSFINIIIVHSIMLGLQHLGMKIRIAACSLIYRKALRLSKSAMVETTVGQMVNLMSNDVNRFDGVTQHLHHLWIAPIETAIVIYLLYTTIHPAAMAGMVILLVFMPIQSYMGKKAAHFRRATAVKTDQRVRLMNEIITGVQVIKMYTWEKPFAKLVEKSRKLEIAQIRASSYLKAVAVSFTIFLNRAAIFFSVLTYVLTGHQLQAQYVYVVTAYYGILRQAITMWLPRGITALAESHVSTKRIEAYLQRDELVPEENFQSYTKAKEATNGFALITRHEEKKIGIQMKEVSVKWAKSLPDQVLTNINFNVEPEQLVAIVGTVGSGKTTLLHIILKELIPITGNLKIEGRISYASQEPWLFAGSIKQNILFGQPMEAKKYQEVIKVCALERDLSLFPYGDRTMIGERGVMLSGGQKARINLARAIYKEADIYLLDDPLSAVDTHVGKQLFDDCITGYLKDKIVVLVTHQLQYLGPADKIYLLENGTVAASGSYSDLQKSGGEFVKLLHNHPEEDDSEETSFLKKSKSANTLEKPDLPAEIKEHRSMGTVSGRVYRKYYSACGHVIIPIFVTFLFILSQLGGSCTDLFLTFWVNIEQERLEEKIVEERGNFTEDNERNATTELKDLFFTPQNCIYIHSFLIAFIIVMTLTRSLSFFKFCMKASQNLHNNMFSKIVYAPMRFFNTNPSGRILNRFSKDMGSIDESLPISLVDTMQVGFTVVATTLVISSVNPWILIPTVIIFIVFYCYRIVFLATSRDLKRIEGITRSPVFSHLTASLQGLTTIRAFGAQDILKSEFDHHQDLHSSAHYMYVGCNRTFGFWLDVNCVIYIALVTLSFLFIGKETYGGNVGLAITQSITMTGMLQWGMRQWSDLENQMTSVERVVEYTEITPEPNDGIKQPPKLWPTTGKIQFLNVSLQYSPETPLVLKNLNFNIESKEKIGIVGRTGAGKSSLISALFRLVQIEGEIVIDGVRSKEISLQNLRSKISIIPQEPVLFSGTLRKNLDPFDQFDDAQLWNALEDVELKNHVADMPLGLQSHISEGGSNFSVGQRQLLCLARAVVSSNKILVLDEATANVDPQTDELIQNTIRKKFGDCTVLTIAHRLHTVLDSDKILVMDAGRVAEFDHPHLLLQDEDGVFYGLIKQTGKGMAEHLTKIAEEVYNKKKRDSST